MILGGMERARCGLASLHCAVACCAAFWACNTPSPSGSVRPPTFESRTLTLPGHHLQTGVVIADFDGDGRKDMAFSAGRHREDSNYVVYNEGLSAGAPTSENVVFEAVGPIGGHSGVVLLKLGTGTNNLVFAGDQSHERPYPITQSKAFHNPGPGVRAWAPEPFWTSPVQDERQTRSVVTADLAKDGFADLLFGSYPPSTAVFDSTEAGIAAIESQILTAPANRVEGLAVGDLNGDGWPDIASGSRLLYKPGDDSIKSNAIYLQKGQGQFEVAPTFVFAPGMQTAGVAIGDLDGDSFMDVITANGAESNRPRQPCFIYWGDGSGEFSDARATVYEPRGAGREVIVGDVNDDGHPDLILVQAGEPTFLYVNQGSRRFRGSALTDGEAVSRGVPLDDLDGNGKLDIVIANYHSPSLILFQK